MAQTITRRDGVAEGLAYKRPVACATTANITLSAEQTIDGIVTSGSRVLVKNQTNTTQNGIYVSATGAWVRALDFDGSTDFTSGTQVYVQSGTTNGQTSFACTVSADPPVVGTSTITWAAQNATIANQAVTNAKLASMADKTVKGNNSGGAASPSDITASNIADMIGSTQGNILYRGASSWAALAPGTSGQILSSGGAGANPSWVASTAATFPIATAAGTADAITATYNPANSSLSNNLLLAFVATAANATTTPTFSPDGLTAHTITKNGGAALAIGDIPGALAVCMVEYNLANTRWELLNPNGTILRGFDTPTNLKITASVASSILTVALKTENGTDPAPGDPIIIPFRDSTVANGDQVLRSVTAATSITTNAIGATLGSVNATAFRFWIVAFDNAGTVVLGLINCSTSTSIFPLDECSVQSSTAMSGAATSAGVYYTPNGTTVTSKSIRIIGFLEYSAGLTTAGTYDIAPTKLQIFGPGVKKPGDVVQTTWTQTGALAAGTTTVPIDNTIPQNTEGDQYMTKAITPTNTANILVIESCWCGTHSASGTWIIVSLFQDSGANALATNAFDTPINNGGLFVTIRWQMLAGTTSSTTFKIRAGGSGAGTTTFNGNAGASQFFNGVYNSYLRVTELVG